MHLPGKDPNTRAPKDNMNMRILQTMVSVIPPCLGPWRQNLRFLCSCGLLGPYTQELSSPQVLWITCSTSTAKTFSPPTMIMSWRRPGLNPMSIPSMVISRNWVSFFLVSLIRVLLVRVYVMAPDLLETPIWPSLTLMRVHVGPRLPRVRVRTLGCREPGEGTRCE